MNKIYKLAIVGATGVVGRTALKVLEEKKLVNFEYTLFSSKRSAGTKLKFLGKEYIVQELTESSFDEGFDFAIFSAGGTTSEKFAPIAVSKGCIVVDNSSTFRMVDSVPLVVPEVNSEEIFKNKGIIANPNCSTIQAVIPLKPLDDKYKIKRIVYSTYQAVSGAGKKGLEDLLTKASYQDLDTYMNDLETEFELFMQQFKYFFDKWLVFKKEFTEQELAQTDITITLDRDMMMNETELIENTVKLSGTGVSQETVDNYNPAVESHEIEQERREQEEQNRLERDNPYNFGNSAEEEETENI